MKTLTPLIAAFPWLVFLAGLPAPAQTLSEADFRDPPEWTRPWCYWYWINDQISKEGITRDLEAMAEVGIGTALIGNQWFEDQPQGPYPVLGEIWLELTRHAIREGGRLGVDIGLFNSPGWSQSGGPWIRPEQSMRYLARSEIQVSGPGAVSGRLPAPGESFQDVALLAFPAPAGESETLPEMRISAEPDWPGLEALIDGDPDTAVPLPGDAATPLTLSLTFAEPHTLRSLTLLPGSGAFQAGMILEAEVDGQWQVLREIQYDRRNPRINVGPLPYGPVYAAFAPVKAQHFSLTVGPRNGEGQLAEAILSGAARVEYAVERQLGKAHPTPSPMWDAYHWPPVPEPGDAQAVVQPGTVQVLNDLLQPDGSFTWNAPPGDWILQRTGMLPTGTRNHPAAPHATGLEVDKISRDHLAHHFAAFVGRVLGGMPEEDRTAFKYAVADSYEMGPQNWTDDMAAAFQQAYGYDPLPWLPVFSGRVVESAEASDRFLWDLRRLVADRVSSEYAGGLRELCEQNGLQMWLENYGHWGFPGEFMQYGGATHLVSGEFWITGSLGNIECRAAASTAHAYGKPVVYAEAFTSGGTWWATPRNMKARGDWAFTEGINHFVLHVYTQQPRDDFVPGVSSWFGTLFHRHNTWFHEAREYYDYLRRCHLLLQSGTHVADFAYFIGEDAPLMTGLREPALPAGYDFDYINAEVILERLTVVDGYWTLPEGKRYAVLVLPPLETMRGAVLEKLRDLVEAGGILYGPPPSRSPSLAGAGDGDDAIRETAAALWPVAETLPGSRAAGKGRVFQDTGLAAVLAHLRLPPDVEGLDPEEILWIHYTSPDHDVYFFSNQTPRPVERHPVVRSAHGRLPEFWEARDGSVTGSGLYRVLPDGRMEVPLNLEPEESRFVLFRKPPPEAPPVTAASGTAAPRRIIPTDGGWRAVFRESGTARLERGDGTVTRIDIPATPPPIALDGPWTLAFPADRDVPETVPLSLPERWTESGDPAVRHFSGSATYRTRFSMDPEQLQPNRYRIELDLGAVDPMARVLLNGKDLGLCWSPPFRRDLTGVLQAGENLLEIRVTNTWQNALVGALRYPEGYPGQPGPKAFHPQVTLLRRLTAESPLIPAGLAGPVRLVFLPVVDFP